MRITIPTLLLMIAVPALALDKPIKGSGKIKTETREIAEFTQLDSAVGADIEIIIGDPEPLKITADDNLLQHIITEVKDDKLTIHNKQSLRPTKGINIVLTTRDLDSLWCRGAGDINLPLLHDDKLDLTLSGAGDLNFADLRLDQLKITLSGSGDVEFVGNLKQLELIISGAGNVKAQGRVASLNATISGAGNINLTKLKSVTAAVTISGAGDAEVLVTDTLSANISGAGSITYHGNPAHVTRSITGAGNVHGK